MGRNDGLITANEAAELLGMTTPNFNCLVKDGYFSPIYPNGRIRGRLFREEEVLEYKKGRLRVSPIAGRIKSTNAQYLAEKAMLLAKQVSVRLDEFCSFLGMDGCRLELNEEGLRRFFKVQGMLDQYYYTVEPKEVFELAKLVQSVDEPYLKFIYKELGHQTPWEPFYKVANKVLNDVLTQDLASNPKLAQATGFLVSARNNLRMVAYFYERSVNGPRKARRTLPDVDPDEEIL